MSMTIYGFYEMNFVNDRFGVEICTHMYWLEPCLTDMAQIDNLQGGKIRLLDKNDIRNLKIEVPELSYENCVRKDTVVSTVIDIRPEQFPTATENGTIIHWEERIRATFHECFELKRFPYDMHHLNMVLRLKSKVDQNLGRYMQPLAAISQRDDSDNSVVLKKGVALPEWRIYRPKEQHKWEEREGAFWRVQGIVRRKHNFFTKNILVQTGALATFGLMAFCQPISDLSVRSRNLLALMLTMVAFKFLVSNSLPKVSYFTLLDIYMTVCTYFLLLILALSSILAYFHTEGIVWPGYEPRKESIHRIEVADRVLFYVFLVAWPLFNLCFYKYVQRLIAQTCEYTGKEIVREPDDSWTPERIRRSQALGPPMPNVKVLSDRSQQRQQTESLSFDDLAVVKKTTTTASDMSSAAITNEIRQRTQRVHEAIEEEHEANMQHQHNQDIEMEIDVAGGALAD
eukprot:TRINITY_DN51776_c0_g1_i1.p1 TRINITY_DN51776_c0_g1~~TRINITY_DN51776_c0_g1_i1.p1  ORF type:complete len:532 (+),score=63.31 TRINITY_DN51776_c0_g1_i1:230-1597(+)